MVSAMLLLLNVYKLYIILDLVLRGLFTCLYHSLPLRHPFLQDGKRKASTSSSADSDNDESSEDDNDSDDDDDVTVVQRSTLTLNIDSCDRSLLGEESVEGRLAKVK